MAIVSRCKRSLFYCFTFTIRGTLDSILF